MLRFSLRTSFLVFSLSCALAAAWAWAMRRDRAEQAAVEYLVQFGGSADWETRHDWAWLPGARSCRAIYLDGLLLKRDLGAQSESTLAQIDWAVLHDLHGLRTARLSGLQLADADLVFVAELRNLESLNLSANRLTDAGLPSLRSLRKLKSLCLSHNPITGDGLGFLADLPVLEELTADYCPLSNQFLLNSARCTRLKELYAWSDRFTDPGLFALGELNDLRMICVGGRFSPHAMQQVAESLFDRNLEDCALHGLDSDFCFPRWLIIH